MNDFDVKGIKFVYQTPNLSLVIVQVLESAKHGISHLFDD